MSSTFTSTVRLQLQGTGDNDGTWGETINTQFSLIDSALNGFKAITVADGSNTVSVASGVSDDARYRILQAEGALTTTATLVYPDIPTFKVVTNYTTGNKTVTFRTSGGTGVSIPASTAILVYSTGTSVLPVTFPMYKNGSVASLVATNLTVANVSITTALTAAAASITNLTATSLTTPNLVATNGSFSGILDVVATASVGVLRATSGQVSGTLTAGVVNCNSIGVSAVDASRVSASTGYFDNLRGGTVCINAAVSKSATPVIVSSPATSLSAGTGWSVGSLTFTPKSTTSRLIVQAYVPVACTTADSVLMTGLFWDGSPTAIDAVNTYNAAISQTLQHTLIAELSPATTGAITVSVRAAKTGLNTGTVNGSNATTKIFITELNA